MSAYDPHQTLAAITHNAVPIVLIGGVSIVAMWVFFVEAARMSRRDSVAPMALWMTVLWWPHDGNYLLKVDDWFSGYHHWFMELFWFAIIVTQSLLEWQAFSVMTICYSIASVGFFGGGFFRSLPYVGICGVASVWSVVNVLQLRSAGAVRHSWASDPARDRQVSASVRPETP